jgi:hypothetical protein
MQCPRDQTDVAKHIGTSPSAGEGARTQASVIHIRIPGRFRPDYPRYSIPLAGHAFLGQPPGHTGGAV